MTVKEQVSKRAMELLKDAVDGWRLSYPEGGPYVRQFEALVEKRHGGHAIAVANATIGLELVFRFLRMAYGVQRVIVPTNGEAADVIAPYHAGMELMFCDVGSQHGMIEESSGVAWACDAVEFVHIGYQAPWLKRIVRESESKGIRVVEDFAHCLGAKGVCEASFAVASLFATKTIPCGEGGVIVVKDKGIADEFRCLRSLGRKIDGGESVTIEATNAKMSELAAAFAIAAMEYVDDLIEERAVLCRLYDAMGFSGDWGGNCYKYVVNVPVGRAEEIRQQVNEAGGSITFGVFRYPLTRQKLSSGIFVGSDLGAVNFCSGHVCPSTSCSLEQARRTGELLMERMK